MQRGWLQKWQNLLFQHFEIQDISDFEKYLPDGCEFDDFEGKYYLGLVLMQMSDVRHKSLKKFVWFESYNELNIRLYIRQNGERGVLFLSLDVDSLLSVLGARLLYGLPYRVRKFHQKDSNSISVFDSKELQFQTKYEILSKPKLYSEGEFAHWATERYFFANKYLGVSFRAEISHKPWELSEAKALNVNLNLFKIYNLHQVDERVFFCHSLDVATGTLRRIKK